MSSGQPVVRQRRTRRPDRPQSPDQIRDVARAQALALHALVQPPLDPGHQATASPSPCSSPPPKWSLRTAVSTQAVVCSRVRTASAKTNTPTTDPSPPRTRHVKRPAAADAASSVRSDCFGKAGTAVNHRSGRRSIDAVRPGSAQACHGRVDQAPHTADRHPRQGMVFPDDGKRDQREKEGRVLGPFSG